MTTATFIASSTASCGHRCSDISASHAVGHCFDGTKVANQTAAAAETPKSCCGIRESCHCDRKASSLPAYSIIGSNNRPLRHVLWASWHPCLWQCGMPRWQDHSHLEARAIPGKPLAIGVSRVDPYDHLLGHREAQMTKQICKHSPSLYPSRPTEQLQQLSVSRWLPILQLATAAPASPAVQS